MLRTDLLFGHPPLRITSDLDFHRRSDVCLLIAGFVAECLAIVCSSIADSIVLRASAVVEGFGFLVIRSRYPLSPDCCFVHALYLAGRVNQYRGLSVVAEGLKL